MQLKKARFAELCGVARSSIGELVKKGTLHENAERKIDLLDPANLSYLSRHNPELARRVQNGDAIDGETPAPIPGATRGPAASKKTATPKPPKRNPIDTEKLERERKDEREFEQGDNSPSAPSGLTAAEFAEITRKQLYDAQKAKADAELKRVQLDKEHDSLGERVVFESFIMELWQSLQRNYIDVAPKQSALICKRLGMVGHELEVIEVLEADVKKRQDSVAHEIQSILSGKMVRDRREELAETEVAE